MKTLAVTLLLVALTIGSQASVLNPSYHIADGLGQETERDSHPFLPTFDIHTGLYKTERCTGALLSKEWILTSAQCTNHLYTIVLAGVHNISAREVVQIHPVYETILHPDWNIKTKKNDIALLRVHPFDLIEGIVSPIRLPKQSQTNSSFLNWPVKIIGWGTIRDGVPKNFSPSKAVRQVSALVAPNSDCDLRSSTTEADRSIICVKAPCVGDVGGPLIIKEDDSEDTVIGIGSWIKGSDCQNSLPAGFTRVTDYLEWIYQTTGLTPRE